MIGIPEEQNVNVMVLDPIPINRERIKGGYYTVMGPLSVGPFLGWLDNNFVVGPTYVVWRIEPWIG